MRASCALIAPLATPQVAMMRLAPVTAVSHGHPVSSGIHREALDYYVSWAAAELPPDQAETHCTPTLTLTLTLTLTRTRTRCIGTRPCCRSSATS